MCIAECCVIVFVTHIFVAFQNFAIFFDFKNMFYEILSNLTDGWTLVFFF